MLYAARVLVPSLARWLLGLGITATLTANMAQGWSHGSVFTSTEVVYPARGPTYLRRSATSH